MNCKHATAKYIKADDRFVCLVCGIDLGDAFYLAMTACEAAAACIWKRKSENAKGIAGPAAVADMIEAAVSCVANQSKSRNYVSRGAEDRFGRPIKTGDYVVRTGKRGQLDFVKIGIVLDIVGRLAKVREVYQDEGLKPLPKNNPETSLLLPVWLVLANDSTPQEYKDILLSG